MKKKLGIFGVIGLALILSFGVPVQSNAATSDSGEEVLAQSKTIYYIDYLPGNVTPSPTYYYNKGGWKGTLSLNGYQYDGTRTIARYYGTVSCSGPCAMTSLEITDK
ncbi:hypothetical protein [Oceanobacillus manasiensis]|uniref:hypothetical protein n=1 Tax=Oceanobacillus manasiensis TaxID=586413 RepID=UPI0005AA84C5|nr:hypothetical protein [Oceanobacillus manasiensis]